MRATVELYKNNKLTTIYPPIKIHISEDEDYASIQVSDQGGGIPSAQLDQIWSYFFTTGHLSTPTVKNKWAGRKDAPMTGFGYGLPLSRTYCRYFGGDLCIQTKEGHGTDAIIYLKNLRNAENPVMELRW